MLKKWIHKFRLSKIVKELPFYLGRDVGQKNCYEGKSLIKIYKKYSFHANYLRYAFALVSSQLEYNKAFGYEEKNTYQKLRKEIAQLYFHGNYKFTFSDLMRITRFKGQVFSSDGAASSGTERPGSNWNFSKNSHGDGGEGGDSG